MQQKSTMGRYIIIILLKNNDNRKFVKQQEADTLFTKKQIDGWQHISHWKQCQGKDSRAMTSKYYIEIKLRILHPEKILLNFESEEIL